jgi:hypothetical protein
MNFKTFLETEERSNVMKMLELIPEKHKKLLHGYKFKYTAGNTLHGDNKHIGFIHKDKIVVAAPWNYSRMFTTLHEVAHLVWEYAVSDKQKKEWSGLVKKTKEKQIAKFDKKAQKNALKQNDEEVFCMAYAATYSTHPPTIWYNDEWVEFMKSL